MTQKLTILFDLDGTLVDTAPDLVLAHNHVMKKFGFPTKPVNEIKALVGMGARTMMGKILWNQAKEELKATNPEDDLIWTEEAEQRIKKVPFFVRGMAKKTVISYAVEKGATTIDAKLMDEVREKVGM